MVLATEAAARCLTAAIPVENPYCSYKPPPRGDISKAAERFSFKVAEHYTQTLGRKSGKVVAKWARDWRVPSPTTQVHAVAWIVAAYHSRQHRRHPKASPESLPRLSSRRLPVVAAHHYYRCFGSKLGLIEKNGCVQYGRYTFMEICCGRALGARRSSTTKTGPRALGGRAADPWRASGPSGPAPAGTSLTGIPKRSLPSPRTCSQALGHARSACSWWVGVRLAA